MKDMRIYILPAVVMFGLILLSADVKCETLETKSSKRVQIEDEKSDKIESTNTNTTTSIDTLSAKQIEDANIRNTFDLTKYSPNAHMEYNYSKNLLVVRGISAIRASICSPVGFYVNDVSYPVQFMQNLDLLEVESAEVLKGPQGTAYGSNTESGLFNIRTKQPGNKYQKKTFGEITSYNTYRSGGSISGPVFHDRLYLGGAVQFKESDGFVENESTGNDESADRKHINGHGCIRWTPTKHWDISVVVDGLNVDNHCGGLRFVNGPKATDPHKHRSDSDEFLKQDGNSQIFRIDYDGDYLDILSVTGAIFNDLEKQSDLDLWDDPTNQKEQIASFEERQFSQEIRAYSPQEGSLSWVAGLYGSINETTIDYRYQLISDGITYIDLMSDIDSRSYAAFGQVTYALWNDLQIKGGLRFDHQEWDGRVDDKTTTDITKDKLRYDEWLPMVSVTYGISKDVVIYATASKGYMAGGFNYSVPPLPSTFTYEPEYTWNYELGIKTTWIEDKLKANISLFYIDIKDKQVLEYDSATLTKTITNGAQAYSQGIEVQLEARPFHDITFFAGFGYNEAKFDEFMATELNVAGTALIERNYKNNYLPYAPKYTYNLGIQYRDGNGIFARADTLGTGKFYGEAANASAQNAYNTFNVRLGYEKKNYNFYLWINNAFDKDYLTSVHSYDGYVIGRDGAPRTIGASLTVRF